MSPAPLPTAGAYRDAVESGSVSFVSDPDLRNGRPVRDPLGLPKGISGNFATVFPIESGSRKYAVKCFTRAVTSQQKRYLTISNALQKVVEPWRVEFKYLQDGIRVQGVVHPVLKMEWVNGTGLVPFVESHLNDPEALRAAAAQLLKAVADLEKSGLGHGDLQHGNILISPGGQLRLIDYDGMYVKGLESLGPSESGHRNFQSPFRTAAHWNERVDRFGAWVIYASLVCLAVDATLWRHLRRDGEEALLFSARDYEAPFSSEAIRVLTSHGRMELRRVAEVMQDLWSKDLEHLPALSEDAFRGGLQVPAGGPYLVGASPSTGVALPSWMDPQPAAPLPPATAGGLVASDWWATHEPLPPPIVFGRRPAWERAAAWVGLILLPLLLVSAAIVHSTELRWLVWDMPWLFLLGAPLSLSGTIAFLQFRYRDSQEWGRKRGVDEEIAIATAAAMEKRAHASRSEALAKSARENCERQEKAAESEFRRTTARLQQELARITQQRREAEFNAQKALSNADQAEMDEMRKALEDAVASAVTTYLESRLVSRCLTGVSFEAIVHLESDGFKTAADVLEKRVVSGGNWPRAEIRHRSRGWVRVPQVGPVRAQALWDWVQLERTRARSKAPAELPGSVRSALVRRWETEREAIRGRLALAQREADSQEASLRTQVDQAGRTFSATQTRIRAEGNKKLASANDSVRGAVRDATAAEVTRQRAVRNATLYEKVSFLEYVRASLRLR